MDQIWIDELCQSAKGRMVKLAEEYAARIVDDIPSYMVGYRATVATKIQQTFLDGGTVALQIFREFMKQDASVLLADQAEIERAMREGMKRR